MAQSVGAPAVDLCRAEYHRFEHRPNRHFYQYLVLLYEGDLLFTTPLEGSQDGRNKKTVSNHLIKCPLVMKLVKLVKIIPRNEQKLAKTIT